MYQLLKMHFRAYFGLAKGSKVKINTVRIPHKNNIMNMEAIDRDFDGQKNFGRLIFDIN